MSQTINKNKTKFSNDTFHNYYQVLYTLKLFTRFFGIYKMSSDYALKMPSSKNIKTHQKNISNNKKYKQKYL